MINLSIDERRLARAVARARERGIVIPTFAQQRNSELVPGWMRARLAGIGLWEIIAENLFRITWKNEPISAGGGFDGVNYLELPSTTTVFYKTALMADNSGNTQPLEGQ